MIPESLVNIKERRMKHLVKTIITIIMLLALTVTMAPVYANTEPVREMRGLWVASVVNIDYPKKPTTDPAVLKSEA